MSQGLQRWVEPCPVTTRERKRDININNFVWWLPGWGGGVVSRPVGQGQMLMCCVQNQPKENKTFRPGTRPGGWVTGVTEKLFMCQMFMCLFRPNNSQNQAHWGQHLLVALEKDRSLKDPGLLKGHYLQCPCARGVLLYKGPYAVNGAPSQKAFWEPFSRIALILRPLASLLNKTPLRTLPGPLPRAPSKLSTLAYTCRHWRLKFPLQWAQKATNVHIVDDCAQIAESGLQRRFSQEIARNCRKPFPAPCAM